jgi:hypothetical protein
MPTGHVRHTAPTPLLCRAWRATEERCAKPRGTRGKGKAVGLEERWAFFCWRRGGGVSCSAIGRMEPWISRERSNEMDVNQVESRERSPVRERGRGVVWKLEGLAGLFVGCVSLWATQSAMRAGHRP